VTPGDDLTAELERLGGEASTVVTSDPADAEEVWRQLPTDRPGVELLLPGTLPGQCQHLAQDVLVETLVAQIETPGDEPPRWEIRLKAICQCGIDFAVARDGRAPRDGSPGTVLVLTPFVCQNPTVPE
jgi:hypothetical protein